jgi:hypothetical protein
MKKFLTILTIATLLASCKKEYTCVCTNKTTGEKTYGDKVRTGKLAKRGYEESCKANEDVFNDVTCELD